MEIILKETIPTLGKAGEVVKVREGYGRNYLLPTRKAVLASRKNIHEMEHHQKGIAAQQAKQIKSASEFKASLDAQVLTIAKEVGAEDRLFGSVTGHEIADLLVQKGFQVDKKMIHLSEPLKALGEFGVSVRLHPEVTATVKVVVVKK